MKDVFGQNGELPLRALNVALSWSTESRLEKLLRIVNFLRTAHSY